MYCKFMSQIKNVQIVLSSGVLTNKNSISVSLNTILPLCSYLKVVKSVEIQTWVSVASSKQEATMSKMEMLIIKAIHALAQTLAVTA